MEINPEWLNQWDTGKETREFPARVVVTISKDVSIPTDTYDEYEQEYDDVSTRIVDTRCVDWEQEYKHNCLTIDDLLHELGTYIKNEFKSGNVSPSRERYLNRLLDACDGWVEQQTIVNEL